MKTIQYLSPSSISKWIDNKEEFYMSYLADTPPPRFPQTQPMSIGSAFDANVKSYLHERLFGKNNDPRFDLDTIFEAQVEPHNRDWALTHGQYAFEEYKKAGCLADLMLELSKAQGDPRFEFEVRGAVNGYREGIESVIGGVTLLGKPDVHFVNHAGTTVILDFKVNGYCSKAGISPMPGYIRMRSSTQTTHKMHKDCQPMMHLGMMINVNKYLEQQDVSWARQLAIYAWLTDCPVGSDFLVGIDQLACRPTGFGRPDIRIAEHRTRISSNFQYQLWNDAVEIWEVTHSDHVFRDKTKALSQSFCQELDRRAVELGGVGDDKDVWFANATRHQNSW